MKTYICHHSPLVERKDNLLAMFEREGISEYQFVEEFHPDGSFVDDFQLEMGDSLSRGKVSLFLKHIKVWECIIDDNKPAFVLEDDCILNVGFSDQLQKIVEQLPPEWDIVYLSEGSGHHMPDTHPDKLLYRKGLYPTEWGGDGAGRCLDCYLISPDYAEKALDSFSTAKEITLPIDWWMNEVAREHTAKAYWAEPTIATQGSITGVYKASY